jgi:hypothetical protein
MDRVEATINEYAKKARRMYKKLFLEPFPINNKEDAQRYIDWLTEYKFYAQMFNDMMLYDWNTDDWEYKNDD